MSHCWQVPPSDEFSTMPVPLAVPQLAGVTSVPLLRLAIV